MAAEDGRIFVHPYDDPDVITGQATIALEIFRQNSVPVDYLFHSDWRRRIGGRHGAGE